MTIMEALAKVKEICSKNLCGACPFWVADERGNYSCTIYNLPMNWELDYIQEKEIDNDN